MQRRLVALGIPVQKVVRKQETGDYVAEFFVPEMTCPTAPANDWARSIQEALPQARIVDTHDTIAQWRSDQPVIAATVIFHLNTPQAA